MPFQILLLDVSQIDRLMRQPDLCFQTVAYHSRMVEFSLTNLITHLIIKISKHQAVEEKRRQKEEEDEVSAYLWRGNTLVVWKMDWAGALIDSPD